MQQSETSHKQYFCQQNVHSHHSNSQNSLASLPTSYITKSVQQISEQLSSQMQLSYFRTIETAFKTSNFNIEICRRFSVNKHKQNDHHIQQQHKYNHLQGGDNKNTKQIIYMPEALLVGNIISIEKIQLPDSPPLLRGLFKSTYDNSQKNILVLWQYYKNNLVKFFNNMIRAKGENSKTKYAFTHLQPILYQNCPFPATTTTIHKPPLLSSNSQNSMSPKCLFFVLQPETQLILLTEQYYFSHMRPIENIFTQSSYFNFSNIRLSKVYSTDELDIDCRNGFVLSQIKSRFQARDKKENSTTIVGIVTSIQKRQIQKNARNKKQMILWLTQVLFKYPLQQNINQQQQYTKIQQLGTCKLIIRYFQNDQSYIENLLQVNHIYVIGQPDILITDNVNIILIINIAKNNAKNHCIFRVTQQPIEGVCFGQVAAYNSNNKSYNFNRMFKISQIQQLLCVKLEISKISAFLEKCINRNIVKLQISLLQIQLLYGSIRCVKCGYQIKNIHDYYVQKMQDQNSNKNQQFQDQDDRINYCRQNHRKYQSLQLWGTIRGADDTGSCLVSMEHKEIVRFLQLQQYYEQIQNLVKKNGKGLVILSSNKQKLKKHEDPLYQIKNRIKRNYVQKIVICSAKADLEKTFRQGLNEQEQLQCQSSFYTTKKYLHNKNIFPNGIIQKRQSQQIIFVPSVKVLQVIQSQQF